MLALANGSRTVLEIAKALGWDEFRTAKVIFQFVQAGLLEKGEERSVPSKKYLGGNFFQRIESELKKIMGPVAPYIIDDRLIEFGESQDSFPQDRASSFIEALSEEIHSDQRRKEFKRTMVELLLIEK